MSNTVDLHLHSTASDGTDTPAQLVEKAVQAGFTTLALTDHDTINGVLEAQQAAQRLGITCLSGVELSVGTHAEIHLLGYGLDVTNDGLHQFLAVMQRDRQIRLKAIVQKMQDAGYPVTWEELLVYAKGTPGRPHLTDVLIQKGIVKNIDDAFDRMIGKNKPFYVPRRKQTIREGVEVIRAAGGIPVFAHPGEFKMEQQNLSALIDYVCGEGVMGIECYHSCHNADTEAFLVQTARRKGLFITGGSDYHGTKKEGLHIGDGTKRWATATEDTQRLLCAISEAKQA